MGLPTPGWRAVAGVTPMTAEGEGCYPTPYRDGWAFEILGNFWDFPVEKRMEAPRRSRAFSGARVSAVFCLLRAPVALPPALSLSPLKGYTTTDQQKDSEQQGQLG